MAYSKFRPHLGVLGCLVTLMILFPRVALANTSTPLISTVLFHL